MFIILINENQCDGCGECVETCPVRCLQMADGKAFFDDTDTACLGCLGCVQVCPHGAPALVEI